MSFFSCCSSSKDIENDLTTNLLADHEKEETCENITESMRGKRFTYHELASATQKFKNSIGYGNLGEGSFGCVYKGRLKSGDLIVVRLLEEKNLEFNTDALMLSHPNLVTLIDCCTNGDQRFLVSEYMPLGSLQNHLFDLKPKQEPLDWDTRLKIAVGVARGLEYLHCKTNPPVTYRNMRVSNILLDNDFNPKLSDCGLVRVNDGYTRYRPIYAHWYSDSAYIMTGEWTLKSDIYSFGVVLLELITGRKAYDDTRKNEEEHNLVSWSRPFFKDHNKFIQLLDPLLQGRAPVRWVKIVVAITALCLEECPGARPLIHNIVLGLQFIASQPQIPDE